MFNVYNISNKYGSMHCSAAPSCISCIVVVYNKMISPAMKCNGMLCKTIHAKRSNRQCDATRPKTV